MGAASARHSLRPHHVTRARLSHDPDALGVAAMLRLVLIRILVCGLRPGCQPRDESQ